jgi:hypothetical protein
MDDLTTLAALITEKNLVDNKIAKILNRPAQVGHAGEYIAAKIFDITLHPSATQKGSDGYFASGPLKGRSVNVKWYLKHENMLDINVKHRPDYYLILAGPKAPPKSSLGVTRPWLIEYVFLFEAQTLIEELQQRKIQIGVATSITAATYTKNEIYPVQHNTQLILTEEQRNQLSLFKTKG